MRAIILAGFTVLTMAVAYAVSVGNSYDQVIKELGKPTGVMGGGNRRVLSYPDGTITIQGDKVAEIDPMFAGRAQKRKMQEVEDAENRAKGLVPFNGRWVTPAEHDALEQARQMAERAARITASAPQTGQTDTPPMMTSIPVLVDRCIPNYTINTKLFDDPPRYFAGELLQRARGEELKDKENKLTPEQCVAYAPGQMTAFLFLPATYDGKTPHGLYVDIRPHNTGSMPESYVRVMNAHRMLFVSPHNAGNEVVTFRRLALALDSMASVKREFNIDSKRVVIGGFSGGGAVACIGLMLYPEYFRGVVSHAKNAALFWRTTADNKMYPPTFPYCQKEDYRRIAGLGKRWVFISGSNDFNYVHVKDCIPQWKQMDFDACFIDAPGMGHSDAPSEYFNQALTWIFR